MSLVFMNRGQLKRKRATAPSKRKQTSLHSAAVAMASSQQSMLPGT